MPYCDVDPRCQLYYEFFTEAGDALTGKPILLMLVSLFHDVMSPSTMAYGTDPAILARFDIVSFDPRGHGRTRCELTPIQDAWTAAGDALVLMSRLQIPAAHILTGHAIGSDTALRMAVLAPDACLTLTLCGVNNQVDTPFFKQALGEVFRQLTCSEEIDDWYEAVEGCIYFEFGAQCPSHFSDIYAGHFLRRYHPRNAAFGFVAAAWWFGRPPVPDDILATISAPINILHGDDDVLYPEGPGRIDRVMQGNPKNRPTLVSIAGCSHNVFSLEPSIVKEKILELPFRPPPDHPVNLPLALHRLSIIAHRTPEIEAPTDFASRRPEHSGSFNVTSSTLAAQRAQEMAEMKGAPPPTFEVPGSDDPEPWEPGAQDAHYHQFSLRYQDRV